jgi:hypothetical protein
LEALYVYHEAWTAETDYGFDTAAGEVEAFCGYSAGGAEELEREGGLGESDYTAVGTQLYGC